MADNDWRGSQYGIELSKAKEIIRDCKKCGGTGLRKHKVLDRVNYSVKELGIDRDLDELDEERGSLEKQRAIDHSKKIKENPNNSSHGLCECRISSEHEQELIKGNIPTSLHNPRFASIIHRDITIVDQKKLDARTFARFYSRKFTAAKKNAIGCNFFGQYGCGKTYLAYFIASQIAIRRYSVHYTPLFLLLEIMGKNGSATNRLFNEIISVDVLILDDIGSEQQFRRANCGELAFYLKQRIHRRKITFFISNIFKNPEEMINSYDSLFYHVMIERNMDVQFKTKVFSKKMNKTRLDKFLKKAT